LINQLKHTVRILKPQQKRKAIRVFFMLILSVVIDFLSLSTILPLILLIVDADSIQTNTYFIWFADLVGISDHKSLVTVVVSIVVSLFIVKTIIRYQIMKIISGFTYEIGESLTLELYRGLFEIDLLNHMDHDTSGDVNKLMNLPAIFASKIMNALMDLCLNLGLIILIVGALLIYDYQVVIYLSAILIPGIIILNRFKKKSLENVSKGLKVSYPAMLKKSLEAIRGYKELISSGKQEYFIKAFYDSNSKLHSDYTKLHVIISSSPLIIELIAIVGICVMLVYYTFLNASGTETIVSFSLFVAGLLRMIPSINTVILSYTNIQGHEYAVMEISEVLDKYRTYEKVPQSTIEFNESIKFEDVSFEYPDSAVELKDLNRIISNGEKIGITGESGSGKATEIHILMTLIWPKDRRVLIDNQLLDKTKVDSWREKMSYVAQDPFILDSTIVENIAIGEELGNVDLEKINYIIENLFLSDLVDQLPDGIYTRIGENGEKISGGQKQRIAIARAIYSNSDIIILDEVTSNLDMENERKIVESMLSDIFRNKTLIFISHHPQVIEYCDRVINIK